MPGKYSQHINKQTNKKHENYINLRTMMNKIIYQDTKDDECQNCLF